MFFWKALRERERAFERERATWAAERRELLDRIMYLSGKPWEMPEHEMPPSDGYDENVIPFPEMALDVDYVD